MKKFFQLRPDQWILFGVLIVAGGLLAITALSDKGERETLPPAKGSPVNPVGMEGYENIGSKWAPPPALRLNEHQIFVSRLIVFSPQTETIGWLNPKDEMADGITAAWKMKFGFSIEDPNLWSQDPDNDGFNNLEEFKAGTDPTDPNSRPSILVKLRMVGYTRIPFRFVFKAANKLPDGSMRFQLNLLDVAKNKTRFVVKGDEVEGYKIGEYREKIVEEMRGGVSYKVDRSELDLTNLRLNEIVTLILNTEQESDESRVAFRVDVPDAKLVPSEVRRGDNFKLTYRSADGKPAEMEFQLLRGNAEEATIKNIQTGEEHVVRAQK